MKKLLTAVVFTLIFSGCAGNMVSQDRPADIAAKPYKSLLVIVRDSGFVSDSAFNIYLDNKPIGETTGNTWFVTPVPPGPHYVIAVGGKAVVSLIDFKPGKTYALRQRVKIGSLRAYPRNFRPISYVETMEAIKNCAYMEYIPIKAVYDMDPDYYKGIIEQYHSELKSNPDSYQALQVYHGF